MTKIGRKLFRARRPEIPRSRDDRAGLLDTFGAASILLLVLRAAQGCAVPGKDSHNNTIRALELSLQAAGTDG